jgi:ATP-dependent DNA helicase
VGHLSPSGISQADDQTDSRTQNVHECKQAHFDWYTAPCKLKPTRTRQVQLTVQNNLAELWSLLNFILPDIFDDLDSFQQWFNFDDMNSGEGNEGILNKGSVVSSLHAILKPFLLRRLKVDVEKDLPPKKEYLLYAPLTQQQKDIYQAIVSRNIRQYLTDKISGKEEEGEAAVEEIAHGNGDVETPRARRKKDRVDYKIEENDSKFIRDLEDGVAKKEPSGVEEKSAAEVGQEWALKQASKWYSVQQ